MLRIWFFVGKWWTRQRRSRSVLGFLDPDLFTSTNISQRSQQVSKAISNLMMNNYYVVGAYCTSHWVTVIICTKFKEVWYLDSAKQHPPLKSPDLQNVLNWSVSCRFCSQKFNLLVFLIGIADHPGPLVQYFLFTKNQSLSVSYWYCWSCRAFGDAQDRVTKGKKKKAKSHTQAQNKSRCKTGVFLWSLLTYLVLH
jgi:hypothetical protein